MALTRRKFDFHAGLYHSLHLLFSFRSLSMTSAAFSCCCLW